MAEKKGEECIQELYIEVSNRSIALSEQTRQVDATISLNPQVPPSKRDPTTEIDDSKRKRTRHEIPLSGDTDNIEQEINMTNTMDDGNQTLLASSSTTPDGQNYEVFSSHHDDEDGDQTSRASSSSTPSPSQNYEVFLSFSGKDTRHGFTDHLFLRLKDKGIETFRDNEELRVGGKIDQLFNAIKASEILVPIISSNYASSIWCLKELLQILKCNKTSGRLVLPIFYKVKPSDVREQKGVFGEKFRLCKNKHGLNAEFVQELENAFKEVALMKGWESDKIADGHEGELVKIVVGRIFNELRKPNLFVPDFLVGVEDHLKEIKQKLYATQSNEAKVIVIHGMGGIGKTTLAKVLYNELSESFECQSFVPNIREASKLKGMEGLQKQVISDILVDKTFRGISHEDEGRTIIEKSFKGTRLLLVLDDVEDREQLDKLAAKNSWFGPESIVIITTRNRDIREASAVNLSYELNELNGEQSYKLFCKHAFKRDAPCPSDLEAITRDIVYGIGGLPLAVEVIGSSLYKQNEGFWRETREKLKMKPHARVQEKLKLSYDALEDGHKQIFLDIACLFCGYFVRHPSYMWQSNGFYPEEGIQKLISLSLIKLSEGMMMMHDQLRDLGREIVRQEGYSNIGNCSRIYREEEAIQVLEKKQGTMNVKALYLIPPTGSYRIHHYTSEHFKGMTNLRYLRTHNVRLEGDFHDLFLNLRWLELTIANDHIDFMGMNFIPNKLVYLSLWGCNITEDWEGWNQMKHLKHLQLYYCHALTATPDFSALKELEELDLHGCRSLEKIHKSIGVLRKTLKILSVVDSYKLVDLPKELGKMEVLRELHICSTSVREVPITKGFLKNLVELFFTHCVELTSIPDSIGSLVKLERLILVGCKSLAEIPKSIGNLESLIELSLESTAVKELPNSIGMLSKLQILDVEGCKGFQSLPDFPASLTILRLPALDALESLSNLSTAKKLKDLSISDCRNLVEINGLEGLESLTELYIETCGKLSKIGGLGDSVVNLRLRVLDALESLPNLSTAKKLKKLSIYECRNLVEINGLEGAESLTKLCIDTCGKLSKIGGMGDSVVKLRLEALDALESLPNLSTAKKLKKLSISKCRNLVEINGLEGAESLTELCIETCGKLSKIGGLGDSVANLTLDALDALESLPNLSTAKKLKVLMIFDCGNLVEINGLEGAESLTTLYIGTCGKLSKIGDLGDLEADLEIFGCRNLVDHRA